MTSAPHPELQNGPGPSKDELLSQAYKRISSLELQIQGVREQCAKVADQSIYGAAVAKNIRALPLPESDTAEKVNRLVEALGLFKWDEQAGDMVLYAQPTGAGFRGRINLSASLSPEALEAFLRVRDEQAAALTALKVFGKGAA